MSVKLRKRKLPSGKTRLYLAIHKDGVRQYESLNFYLTSDKNKNKELLQLAEAIRAKRELQVHSEAEGISVRGRSKTNFFDYAETVYTAKRTPNQAMYVNALEHLRTFAGADLNFSRATQHFFEQFKSYMLTTVNLKPSSAAAYYARIRTIIKQAVRDGILTASSAEGITFKHTESLPKYLTQKQVQDLANAKCGNPEIRNAFLFACFTGLRYADVKLLKWKQIRESSIQLVQKKTGTAQMVPLHDVATLILGTQKKAQGGEAKSEGQIFSLPRRSTIDKVLKTWGRRAKVDIPLSFHKARHTFATMTLTSGGDIYTTSKLLGHKDLHTTQIYAKVVDKLQESTIKQIPSINI